MFKEFRTIKYVFLTFEAQRDIGLAIFNFWGFFMIYTDGRKDFGHIT
jgi:hypothetical protein